MSNTTFDEKHQNWVAALESHNTDTDNNNWKKLYNAIPSLIDIATTATNSNWTEGNPCPYCNSTMYFERVAIGLELVEHRNGNHRTTDGAGTTNVLAWVCSGCENIVQTSPVGVAIHALEHLSLEIADEHMQQKIIDAIHSVENSASHDVWSVGQPCPDCGHHYLAEKIVFTEPAAVSEENGSMYLTGGLPKHLLIPSRWCDSCQYTILEMFPDSFLNTYSL